MSSWPSLLEAIARLLERSYRMDSGLAAVAPFVIGDLGYRRFYAREAGPGLDRVGSGDGQGARTLVRETAEGVRACIYFPDAMIQRLEEFPPQAGVGEENVDPFATFVEEIDHLLLIAERARLGRPVTLFELELHANVSKYLVLARFLAARQASLGPREQLWLRHQLFEKAAYCDEDPAVRDRYRDAVRWAVRLLDGLDHLRASTRVESLRRFHAVGATAKLELIDRLAA